MLHRKTSVVVSLFVTLPLVAGCSDLPTEGPGAALLEDAPLAEAPPKDVLPGGSQGSAYAGPMPGAWVEPSPQLLTLAADGELPAGGEGLDLVLQGLDLVLGPCVDPAEVTLRVALLQDGAVIGEAASEGGVFFESDGEEIVAGGGSAAGPDPKSGACPRAGSPVRYTDWGAFGADLDEVVPPAFAWPKQWVPARELPGGSAFLKAKKAFLKAKKAFVPAPVVFDGSRDWFPEDDTPILSGGFSDAAPDDAPDWAPSDKPDWTGGTVVVVGVMPGDNVSVMPGDNVSTQRSGALFLHDGPSDD